MKYNVEKCDCGNFVDLGEFYCDSCQSFDTEEAFYTDKMLDDMILDNYSPKGSLDNLKDITIKRMV